MIRQAIILAAGEGKRMKKTATDQTMLNTPKPLLKLGDMTIIEYTIRKLYSYGIEIAIVVNKKDDQIFREKLKEYNIHYYYQQEPLGTANALYSAQKFVKDPYFLVFMGDDLYGFNVEELVGFEAPAVFGYMVADLSRYGAVKIDADGFAYEIVEKKESGRGIANTGAYIMPASFFELYPSINSNKGSGEFYLTDIVKFLYFQNQGFKVKLMQYWRPINDAQELELAAKELAKFDYLSLNLRMAKMRDLEAMLDILYQLSPLEPVDPHQINDVKNSFEKMLSNDDYYVLVAEKDGRVLATATLLIQQNITHHGRSYGHIENVVTDRTVRGLGIGKRMVEHLIGIAKLRNCYKVILVCSPKNVEFYQKCGFVKTGELEMRINL
ncbi:MAG: GNAT family N-acetyltransferase [Candidatus Micrarchaeaceae archaeon]